jgi:hypothetical protein
MKKQILSLLASAFIATNPVKAANLTERVFVEELGVNSQTTISHTSEDKTKVKALAETLPNNYEDYGLDVRNSIYRANFSLDDGVNRESRTSLTLYGDTYNSSDPANPMRYSAHLQAMQDAGYMKVINNPQIQEERVYVWIMFMRVYKAWLAEREAYEPNAVETTGDNTVSTT